MEEKDLFKKISEESENNVPDVYDKILFAAHAQGLFNNEDTEAYSDGETVALGGVNKKAIVLTTLASVAAVCLAIALPIALSGKYDSGISIPPVGDDKVVADIDLGDSYVYGAVTTSRLAESFLNTPSQGATAMAKRTVSENELSEFGTYFSALDCYLGSGLFRVVSAPFKDYQKSITISGRRVSGAAVDYSMYYTEYKIVQKDYVTGTPVNYYLEGKIIEGYRAINLIGERTLASDAEGAEETAFNVYAYPDLSDITTYVQMKLGFEEIDGVTVRSYSYKIVSNNGTVSEAVSYKTDDAGLVIKIKDGETDKGVFAVTDEEAEGGYKGSFDFGEEKGEFTVKVTDNGFSYEFPDPVEKISFLGYRDNGDGTYSVSTYDVNADLPEKLVIPSTYNGKPVVSILSAVFRHSPFKKVVISEGVTKLESVSFADCEQLEEVVLPSTLTVIGNQSFARCEKLKLINLPSNLTQIGEWAFANCSSLTEVIVPNGVKTIKMYAFSGCSSLVSINLPASVTNIWCGILNGCSMLESITVEEGNPVYHSAGNCLIDTENATLIEGCKASVIPNDGSVTVIGEDAFRKIGLTTINLPSSVKSIQATAFADNDFTYVVLPEGLEDIGDGAFAGCVELTGILLPTSLVSIGEYAFQWCRALTSVMIPENVNSIGVAAFQGCDELKVIVIDVDNPVYFDNCGNCIIERATKTLTHGCVGTTIPCDGSVEAIGKMAFAYCKIYSVSIPWDVKTIAEDAFLSCDLQLGVYIEGATHIENSAFSGCYFKGIWLPDSLTEIGSGAFWGCQDLKEINYDGTMADWVAVRKDETWNSSTGDYVVNCTDGTLAKDGTVIN